MAVASARARPRRAPLARARAADVSSELPPSADTFHGGESTPLVMCMPAGSATEQQHLRAARRGACA